MVWREKIRPFTPFFLKIFPAKLKQVHTWDRKLSIHSLFPLFFHFSIDFWDNFIRCYISGICSQILQRSFRCIRTLHLRQTDQHTSIESFSGIAIFLSKILTKLNEPFLMKKFWILASFLSTLHLFSKHQCIRQVRFQNSFSQLTYVFLFHFNTCYYGWNFRVMSRHIQKCSNVGEQTLEQRCQVWFAMLQSLCVYKVLLFWQCLGRYVFVVRIMTR